MWPNVESSKKGQDVQTSAVQQLKSKKDVSGIIPTLQDLTISTRATDASVKSDDKEKKAIDPDEIALGIVKQFGIKYYAAFDTQDDGVKRSWLAAFNFGHVPYAVVIVDGKVLFSGQPDETKYTQVLDQLRASSDTTANALSSVTKGTCAAPKPVKFHIGSTSPVASSSEIDPALEKELTNYQSSKVALTPALSTSSISVELPDDRDSDSYRFGTFFKAEPYEPRLTVSWTIPKGVVMIHYWSRSRDDELVAFAVLAKRFCAAMSFAVVLPHEYTENESSFTDEQLQEMHNFVAPCVLLDERLKPLPAPESTKYVAHTVGNTESQTNDSGFMPLPPLKMIRDPPRCLAHRCANIFGTVYIPNESFTLTFVKGDLWYAGKLYGAYAAACKAIESEYAPSDIQELLLDD